MRRKPGVGSRTCTPELDRFKREGATHGAPFLFCGSVAPARGVLHISPRARAGASASTSPQEFIMAFTLPPLPYDYAALEPHIDEQTMRIHHDKHHAAYVNNLNTALEPHANLQSKSIEELIGEYRRAAGSDPRAGAQQRRRTLQPPSSGRSWLRAERRGAHRRAGRGDQQGLRRLRRLQGAVHQGRRSAGSAAAGRGSRSTGRQAVAIESTAQPGQPRHGGQDAPSWAATCGNTPTISSTRTGAPTTSPRGGTWSTGRRWGNGSRCRRSRETGEDEVRFVET